MLSFQHAAMKNTEVKSREDIEVYCLQCIESAESDTVRQNQLDRAATNFDFYRGAQWTREEHDAYTSSGVTPMTINRCRPQIKALLGLYSGNRQEIKVIPRKGGTEVAANVYSELLRHTHDRTNGDYVFLETFRKGAIETESWLHFDNNKAKTAGGQFTYYAISIGDAFPDPGCRQYDINEEGHESRFFVYRTYKTLEELELLYPDYADSFKAVSNPTHNHILQTANSLLHQMGDDVAQHFRLSVRYVWWRQARMAAVLSDIQKRTTTVLTDAASIKKANRRAKKSRRFEVIDFVDYVLHKSVVVNDILVDDEKDPFGDGFNKLPFARFSPFYDNGQADGILDDVVSLNKEENINRTQATRYLNQTVNSGWLVDDDSNKEAVRQLQTYGAVNGIVIGKNKFGGGVEKILPNSLSQGHIFTAERSNQDIKEITGLNDDVMGYDKGAKESGRAISLRQKQGIQSNEPLFQNFYLTLQLFGQMVFDALRTSEVYTDIEIRQIVQESSLLSQDNLKEAEQRLTDRLGGGLPAPSRLQPPAPEILGAMNIDQRLQAFDQIASGIQSSQIYASKYPLLRQGWNDVIKEYAVTLLLAELKQETLGEYGVKVITSPMAQSVRMQNFAELDAIQEKYGVVPPDVFVEATDLPNKEELISRMKETQAQQAAMPPAGAAQAVA